MSVHSLTTAPINVYSKTYWTGFIQAINEEAAYELGLHDNINPEAVRESVARGWNASLFTPNILNHTDFYVDNSTKIDLSRHTTHEHHHHYEAPSIPRPLTKAEQEAKKKEEEENSLNKYKFLGPIIGAIGGFLSAYTWRGYQRCKATYDHTHQVSHDLKTGLRQDWTPLKLTLERIVTLKHKVDEIRYKIIYRYFIASAGILVGGGLLTLGAYAKEPRLIPWGGIALAVSAIWAAISAGFHWQDNKDIRSLYEVIALDPERLADTALWNLQSYYQEGMTLNPPQYYAPPPYQPFFNSPHQELLQVPPPSFNPEYTDAHYPTAPTLYSFQLPQPAKASPEDSFLN